MAIDRWLFDQHRQGHHPPTLRFYTWSPVAISLGYHQRQWPAAWNQLTWQGKPIPLVRRPTGGRAVLHQGDLTYMVVASGLGRDRRQRYQTLCSFLIQGWQTLGVSLTYGEAGRGYIHNPNCFGTATAADLVMADGTKLIGSAQLQSGDAVLQHGSIRLTPDPRLFAQVFGVDTPVPTFPPQVTPSANSLHPFQVVMDALIAAACDRFQINLVSDPLSPSEWQAIESIIC